MSDHTEARETYLKYQQAYEYIQDRLDQTHQTVRTATEQTRQILLWLADTYALITSNTNVEAHDLALAGIAQEPFDPDHVRSMIHPDNTRARTTNHVVLYHNQKPDYIEYNRTHVDYARQSELFQAKKYDELHELKADTVKGLKATKAAFSLAMCGVTEKACLDSNMVRSFGLGDVNFETIDVEAYDELVAECRAQTPALSPQTTPFVWQWAVWDHVRESAVTAHDVWFMTINEYSEIDQTKQPLTV